MPCPKDSVEKKGYSASQVNKNERSFYPSFKLKVVKCADTEGVKAAARKFGVEPKSIRGWRKQRTELKCAHSTRQSFRGPRRGKWPQIEEECVQYINNARAQLCAVTKKMIQREAWRVATKHNVSRRDFKGSLNWVQRMMKRNNFSIRRRTTVSQKLPKDYEEKLMKFQMYVIALRKRAKYLMGHIGNVDQTPLYLDMPSRTTVHRKGEKSVSIKTTGNEKTRFTVMLSVTADGRKLPPYIVFKRKTIPPGKFPHGVIIRAHESGSFNEDITIDWLKAVWARRPGALLNRDSMLVLDSFTDHLTEKVKKAMKNLKTDMVIIPGGRTSILQPLDLSINKPFKEKVMECYADWMLKGDKEYTPAGKIRRPDPVLVSNWVLTAWKSIPERIVEKSLKKASISNALDGFEDDMLWEVSSDEDDEDYDDRSDGATSSEEESEESSEAEELQDEDDF